MILYISKNFSTGCNLKKLSQSSLQPIVSETVVSFLLHNSYLNLFVQAEDSKWLLCSRKTGVKDFRYIKYIIKTFFLKAIQLMSL